jgi:hypothetical protein
MGSRSQPSGFSLFRPEQVRGASSVFISHVFTPLQMGTSALPEMGFRKMAGTPASKYGAFFLSSATFFESDRPPRHPLKQVVSDADGRSEK